MSYGQIVKYKVIPETTYQIIRNCSGCGCKSNYVSTNDLKYVNYNRTYVAAKATMYPLMNLESMLMEIK